jgi:hypothetical protein
MATLCEEPPRFYNLDVKQTWSAGTSTTTKAAVASRDRAGWRSRNRPDRSSATSPGEKGTTASNNNEPNHNTAPAAPPRVVADGEGETATGVN